MKFRDILDLHHCWTGRRWINFFSGMLAVGFTVGHWELGIENFSVRIWGIRVDQMMVNRRWVILKRAGSSRNFARERNAVLDKLRAERS